MERHAIKAVVVGGALLLGGCNVMMDDVWPTLTGEEPSGKRERIVIGAAEPEQNEQPTLSPGPGQVQVESPTVGAAQQQPAQQQQQPSFQTAQPAPMPQPAQQQPAQQQRQQPQQQQQVIGNTGTFVGSKVLQHARELQQLRQSVNSSEARFQQLRTTTEQNAQRYYAIVAAITARLQIGTTPGNPVLVSQWNTAQSELDRILTDIAALNTLANDIAGQSTMSSYLLGAIRAAYNLSGAVEQDHRNLATLEDEINRTVVSIDRLLSSLDDTIKRQTAYVNNERRHLTQLSLAIKNGEMFGPPLASQAFASAPAGAAAAQPSLGRGAAAAPSGQPLVVIRFDRPDVPYEQALYSAVSQALSQLPSASFEVVAVAPDTGSPAESALGANKAKRNAEQVYRSLTEMGLPGDRVALSTTTSAAVQTNEVHVYVR